MSRKALFYAMSAALTAAALLGFLLSGCGDSRTVDVVSERPAEETAMVVKVTDGDTIRVRFADGREEKVRYIGIDTPEMDQPFGEEAKDANQALVAGREVRLVRDVSERDRYGRLLRYVYVGELFVNAELVRTGLAHAATYPPDVAFADYLASLQHEAESAGKGLWAFP